MSIARFSVNQIVLVNLLFVIFIAAGGVVYSLLPVDVYPDTSLDLALVETTWAGASAEDVERLVTRIIEDEVRDVAGQQRLYSYSLPGFSIVGIKFREDLSRAEFEKAFDEMRLAVDRVTDLPDDADEPVLRRLTVDEIWPLIQVAVVDRGAGEATVRRVARDLKDELKSLPGVSRVREIATRDPEVHILLDSAQLEKHDLSILDVAATLESRNLNVPAGVLQTSDAEIAVRSIGEVQDPRQLGEIVVLSNPDGSHLRVNDIATIEGGFERAIWAARYGGKPCALLYISKDRLANALTVRDAVAQQVNTYLGQLTPPGVEIHLTGDSTTMIASRLSVLKRNLLVGIVLVFIVLWMVIGLRNSMLAIVGVPFSFLCAFIFMYGIGVSINAVSVFSLVLVSGIIVDDAIVVLENIYRHVQEGVPLKRAVIDGTAEVTWPVVSSTATTVAAFMPLLLMPGVIGRFFSIVPKTVTVALLASLFECLLILPAHYLDWGRRLRPGGARGPRRVDGARSPLIPRVGAWLLTTYDLVLGQTLRYRYLAILLIGAAGMLAYQAQRTLVRDLFPSDFPTFIVDFNARPGAGLDETDRVASQISPVMDALMPETIARYATALGVQWNEDNQRVLRTNLVQMWVDIAQDHGRSHDPALAMNKVRDALTEFLEAHPECGIENLRVWPIRDGPPVGKPIAIRIEHPDYDVAAQISEQIKAKLRTFPGVHDVADNLQSGHRELQLAFREARAADLGVTYTELATSVRAANDGLKVGVFKDIESGDDVDIKVRLDRRDLTSPDDLDDILVSRVDRRRVKLRDVADLTYDRSYAARYHFNNRRAVQITADVDPATGTDAVAVGQAILDEFTPLERQDANLRIRAQGQFEETQQSFNGLWRS
ncbi:MAG: efflux RND transporter permease subunit, partial [Phycisphaerae bacterium]